MKAALCLPVNESAAQAELQRGHFYGAGPPFAPMSLTSVLCKIFEKLLKKTLLLFLTETRSLSPSQHGFLPRRSCLSNLILQEERVTLLLDEGHAVDLVFLEFAKAFDSVNHQF